MKVRITSVNGETLEDTIASAPHCSLFLAHDLELKLVALCGKLTPHRASELNSRVQRLHGYFCILVMNR